MPKIKSREIYGPWPGGVNFRDSLDQLSDRELAYCKNFDTKDDGTLVARATFTFIDDELDGIDAAPLLVGSTLGDNFNDVYVWFKSQTGTQFWYYYTDNTPHRTTYTGLTATSGYYETLKYNGFTYFVNTALGTTFRVTADATSGAATLVTNWPASAIDNPYVGRSFIFKDRAWVVLNNRIYYSKATDPTIWNSSGAGAANMFFDVGPGDGDMISSVVVQNDSIYIFKNKSVWVLRYITDPAVDGSLQVIVQGKGAEFAIAYENEIYTVDAFSVYIFRNNGFTDIGRSLDISITGNSGNSNSRVLHVWNNRLFYSNQDVYVMNLKNGAWTYYTLEIGYSYGSSNGVYSDSNLQAFKFANHSDYQSSVYVCSYTGNYRVAERHKSRTSYDKVRIALSDLNGIPTYSEIRYCIPSRQIISKAFTYNDEFTWKKLYALRVQRDNSFIVGEQEDVGKWYAAEATLGIIDRPSLVTTLDAGLIPLHGTFRFKSIYLNWVSPSMFAESQIQFEDSASYEPTFKKLQLTVAKGAET